MRIELDIPLSLSEICAASGGLLECGDATIRHICTDSREVARGDLFIAISGERWDGNDFAREVRERGGYVLGQKDASIYVSDTEAAMLSLTSLYRRRLPSLKHTVAITGSVGKTTTKELTARILSAKYRVHTNLGNFNNTVGILHTVLSARRDTEVLTVEMGMNHSGEISRLSRAVMPDTAVITNVGTAHIGNLGSREAIASAKLEICDGLRDGVLIVPYGEPLLRLGKTVSVGCGGDFALNIEKVDADGSIFSFLGKDTALNGAQVALVGTHLLTALAFAISIGEVCGLGEDDIRRGLSRIDSSCLRQKRMRVGRYDIYDDTYSSSPEAAIAVIRALTQQSPAVSAVLGDMLELGDKCAELHRKVGAVAAECGVRLLYLFGRFAEYVRDGALEYGMPEECIFVNSEGDLRHTAKDISHTYGGEVLIVKASHAVHAERLYDFLKD